MRSVSWIHDGRNGIGVTGHVNVSGSVGVVSDQKGNWWNKSLKTLANPTLAHKKESIIQSASDRVSSSNKKIESKRTA